jgi:hypothetical protein
MAPKTGNAIINLKNDGKRGKLIFVIDAMVKDSRWIDSLHDIVTVQNINTLSAPTNIAALSKLAWTGKYRNIGKIPSSWKQGFLISRYSSHPVRPLTSDLCARIIDKDPDGIDILFHFETQLANECKFPKEMADKHIATSCVNHWADHNGSRLDLFLKNKGVLSDGTINIAAQGCAYTLQLNKNGICIEIKHISGARYVPPPHVVITEKFKLHDNHSDELATVTLAPTSYTLVDLFEASTTFKQHIKDNADGSLLADYAKMIHAVDVVKKREVVSTTIEEDVVPFEVRLKRKAVGQLSRAREKLKEKKQAGMDRRANTLPAAVAPAKPAPPPQS